MGRRGQFLIEQERLRQQAVEGFDALHDADHRDGELAIAARCYFENATLDTLPYDEIHPEWPFFRRDWKPKDEISDLIRAGALYQAEIDRLT